jgi:hypothetical protein
MVASLETIYTQYEHMWVLRNPAWKGRRFPNAVAYDPNHPAAGKVRRITTRKLSYPHNEQIKYSIPPSAWPDARVAKSSELIALICKAALRGGFSRRSALGF